MANKSKKRGVIVNYDIIARTQKLNDEQFGKLMRALISYDETGVIPSLDVSIEPYFDVIKVDIDENKAEYDRKCLENKAKLDRYWEDVKKGLKNRKNNKDTNVYNGIQMYTNDTDKIIKSSSNIESSSNYNNIKKTQTTDSSNIDNSLNIGSFPKENSSPASLSLATTPKFDKKEYINSLFEKVWAIYPRKVGKEQAKKTWFKKLSYLKDANDILGRAKTICLHLNKHIKAWAEETGKDGNKGRPKQFLPHFSSWLNDEIPDKE